jgi:hypothetical protein
MRFFVDKSPTRGAEYLEGSSNVDQSQVMESIDLKDETSKVIEFQERNPTYL